MFLRVFIVLSLFGFSLISHAQSQSQAYSQPLTRKQRASEEFTEAMKLHNFHLSRMLHKKRGGRSGRQSIYTPFAEYEETGYLIFSDPLQEGRDYSAEAQQAKYDMALYMPKDVTLVVYTSISSQIHARAIRRFFKGAIDSRRRLKIVYTEDGQKGFWARDGVPVPMVDDEGQLQEVIDAVYYHKFEDDERFAELFDAGLQAHNYYFEGGNFVANSQGDCLVVNNKTTREIPTSIFSEYYGCRTLMRFKHRHGIGHADEVLKFVSDDTVITSDSGYADRLMIEGGYNVVMMPKPLGKYETHVNSLIINGVVFFPAYDQASDDQAYAIYENLGFEAYPLESTVLSNEGLGSLHCITMTYPKGPFKDLLSEMRGRVID